MIKLMIISHTFQKKEYYHRWELLSEMHEDLDITLLAPEEWNWGIEKNLTFGSVNKLEGEIIEKQRFRIHLIDMGKGRLTDWTSRKMVDEVLSFKPDIVYFLSYHTQLAICQMLHIRKRYKLNDMKVIAFSMRGTTQPVKYTFKRNNPYREARRFAGFLYTKAKLNYFNKNCDAVFCHYPDAVEEFRREGYKKDIYMQTQVGYDPDIFYPNSESRKIIRTKYGIGDEFVFGSASRFHYSKGLLNVIKALPECGDWKYLIMGWGNQDEVDAIEEAIRERKLESNIILTGFISDPKDMAAHWNAVDCAIHVPLTTPLWEETFSLALVQAMGTGLPVIGSSSGSVPYQIGPNGVIVEEGNIDALRGKMLWIMNESEQRKAIGKKMYERALSGFNIYHLNELFYLTILDIVRGVYDPYKSDMTSFTTQEKKEYVSLDR